MGKLERTPEKLLYLYEKMYELRRFEEEASTTYKAGEIPGFVHLYHGEEAVAAGVCANLGDDDIVSSTHRGHGHAVAKGVPAKEALAELYGKEGGCSRGRGGSMHMYKKEVGFLGTNGMVGGGIGLGVGAGLTIKTLKKDAVSVVFFGDGASNMGIFYESLNLASVLKLPVIFICENNLYATSTPLKDVAANPEIATRGNAFNMDSVAIDGNDVIAVYETVSDAIERAKRGDGPTLIEAKTYRHHGHHEGDQIYGTYRTKEELDTWVRMKDPISNYKKRLIDVFGISEQQIADSEKIIEEDIQEAIAYSRDSREPDPADVEKYVFKEAK